MKHDDQAFIRQQLQAIQACLQRVQQGGEDQFLQTARVSREDRVNWLRAEELRLQQELQMLEVQPIVTECPF